MGNDRVEGETWWESEMRLGHYRLCIYRRVWPGAIWVQGLPTGWSVTQEDRVDGKWMVTQYGLSKTVVGSKEEAMAFAEATYRLLGN